MRYRRAKDSGRQSQMDELEEEGFKEDPAKWVGGWWHITRRWWMKISDFKKWWQENKCRSVRCALRSLDRDGCKDESFLLISIVEQKRQTKSIKGFYKATQSVVVNFRWVTDSYTEGAGRWRETNTAAKKPTKHTKEKKKRNEYCVGNSYVCTSKEDYPIKNGNKVIVLKICQAISAQWSAAILLV